MIPSLISTLDKDSLASGTYVGLHSGAKVELINEGGFIQAAPHLKAVYEVANIRPATLGGEAATVSDNELFIKENSDVRVGEFSFDVLLHDLQKDDEALLRPFWIPGTFTCANEGIRGWINMKGKKLLLQSRPITPFHAENVVFESRYKFNLQHLTFTIPKGVSDDESRQP